MQVSTDDVRSALDRVCRSRSFAHAERLRAFLSFVVHEKLAGRGDQLKEYLIGCQVCGRPESFDPKQDAIVRVDANRLRSRLQAYYESEGGSDAIQITIPKGAYAPVFELRESGNTGFRLPRSIAVLPFVNLGSAGEDDFLSDSLTEELIHSLARVPDLRVIARSSAFQFKGFSEDGRSIGRRLQVGYVLEGSTRLSGTRLRITVQLIEVETGWLLWSEKFERDWDTLFAVQDEIVASITDALTIRLTEENSKLLFNTAKITADSYSEYLKGRYFWNQRTPEALADSVRCYEKALALDPGCVSAYSGLAETYMVMALNDQEPTPALMLKARSAARRAIELRPEWPDALVSLGTVKSIFDWDWEGGERAFDNALRLVPGSATVHYLYAMVNLQPRAQWERALAHMEAAIQLDPVSPVLHRDLGIIHFMRRMWDEAECCFNAAEHLAPTFRGTLYWKARISIERARYDEAIRALEQRLAKGDANTRVTATIAYAAGRAGDGAAAARILDQLFERMRSQRVPPLDMAFVFLGIADWDSALVWLNRACEERAATLYQFNVDPIYDPVRADPRSEGIRLAMGLPV